jgi:large conductance mechanosensitive channel
VDFANLFISLNGESYANLAAAKAAGAPTINYGIFINNVIAFLIVAFCVFLLVKMVNRWSAKPAPAAAPTTKECGYCKTEIPIKATRCPNCTSQLQAA